MPIAMKIRSSSERLKSYGGIHQELISRGFKPKLQTMDNEESSALKRYLTENNVSYQLVPPHYHRYNKAERAICTFKEHFVAGLASVDPDLPMHLWDRLLSRAGLTINLLRTSRLHPQMTAAAHLCGIIL
jgi:hypothetical protein